MVPESHSEALEILDHLSSWEVGSSIEGHVLEKVSQSLLIVVFHERAGIDVESHADPVRWLGIRKNGVAKSIIENAPGYSGVGLDVAIFLGKWNRVVLGQDGQCNQCCNDGKQAGGDSGDHNMGAIQEEDVCLMGNEMNQRLTGNWLKITQSE